MDKEKEKWVNEFMELLKIRLEQIVFSEEPALLKIGFWKKFERFRIIVKIRVEK